MELSVKKLININIRNYVMFVILVTIMILFSSIDKIPTAINRIFGPFELDYDHALRKENMVDNIGTSYYRQGIDTYSLEYFNYKNVYKQSSMYEFEIDPINVYDLGLYYETTTTFAVNNLNFGSDTLLSHKYILLDVGTAWILTRVEPNFEIKDNQTYKGVFIPISSIVLRDMMHGVNQDDFINNVFGYELDTINSFFTFELNDFVMIFVYTIILLILWIQLIKYIISYKKHPTYKQFSKIYGDTGENIENINLELQDTAKLEIVGKNSYKTEHWIIEKHIFRTKITMAPVKSSFDD